jgi:hypothetical protein
VDKCGISVQSVAIFWVQMWFTADKRSTIKEGEETAILFHQTTRRHITKDNGLHNYHRQNSKSHIPVLGGWATFYYFNPSPFKFSLIQFVEQSEHAGISDSSYNSTGVSSPKQRRRLKFLFKYNSQSMKRLTTNTFKCLSTSHTALFPNK